jgi:hypothetical protein
MINANLLWVKFVMTVNHAETVPKSKQCTGFGLAWKRPAVDLSGS